jgi:hypothetical protein
MANKPRLSWSKQPNEQGMAQVGQGPRGAILKVNGVIVGRVYANGVGFHNYKGWYWTAYHTQKEDPKCPPIVLKNTWETPIADLNDAKLACEAYVREQLGMT